MRLLQLEFRRILTSNDAFVVLDIVRQAVQKRRLARARTARDHDIGADLADDLEHFRARRRDGPRT